VKRTSLADFDCSIAQTLEVVGDPWTLLVIRDAFFGLRRFDEFRESLGIPRATLAARLATLVEHGALETHRYSERPPRHEYRLTAKGRALGPLLVAMLQWGDRWSGVDEPPVSLFDVDTGEPVEPRFVDARTGRGLDEIRLERRRRQAATPRPS
jgi:DNA-binding HxlR family transcriptional regulator